MIRILAFAAFCLAAGAAAARPAMTADATTMRAAPSGKARVVQKIPPHAQIDVSDCGESWCAASWRDLDGFVRVEAIAPNDAPLAGPPPVVVGGPFVVAPMFGFGYYRRW